MPAEIELPNDLKPLAWRQAIDLSDTNWDAAIEQLIETLAKILAGEPRPRTTTPEQETLPSPTRTDMFQELLLADRVVDDLALTQGACGGDLLFTEACLQRGVKVHWLQPFDEPDFIQRSVVRCGGESWRPRYLDAKAKLAGPIRSAPEELGDFPPGSEPGYPYECCNLWLLYTALACGVDKVRFICLWNGGGGDGPGGTAHMYAEVKRRTGQVNWIDIRKI